MAGLFGTHTVDRATREMRQQEARRQAAIQQGLLDIKNIFKPFDENFYKGRADAYTQYAMPQFTRQFADASRNLGGSLASKGLFDSSAARKSYSDLGYQANVQKQGIIDTGTEQANTLRKNVEQQRSNLIGQLQASADPITSSQNALASASNMMLPSTFQPLGNLFTNYARTYALNQQGQMYNQFSQGLGMGSNNPLGTSSYRLTS